jgi:short-subunit dehydrogenase
MTKNGTILITGCSSGIGRAAAIGLSERGIRVIAATRTIDQARELYQATGITTVQIDNNDRDSIERGWGQAVDMAAGAGGITGVFANAGWGMAGALEDTSWEAMQAQLTTNVLGTHELTRLAVRYMRARGIGRVVICSSVLGVLAMRMRGAYVGSKFCLEGLADVWRLELRGSNVKVCLLEPGPVMTMFRPNSLKAFRRYINRETSVHKDAYDRLEERLEKAGPVAPFTAESSSCIRPLLHAFTAKNPKARYRWTVQTHIFSILKRLLPTRLMDTIAAKG